MSRPSRRLACIILFSLALWDGLAQARQPDAEPADSGKAAAATSSNLPLRREEARPPDAAPWVTGGALLALIAVAGALVAVRRGRWQLLPVGRTEAEPARLIVRLASQPLTAQASVHAIRWNGEELLVGCNAQQMTVLARRSAASVGCGQP